MLNNPTLYNNVTTHLNKTYDNGNFVGTLQNFMLFVQRYLAAKDSVGHRKLEGDNPHVIGSSFSEFTRDAAWIIGGTIEVVSTSVDVNSYLEACKCESAAS